jgi:LPS sulfotransferase NodH
MSAPTTSAARPAGKPYDLATAAYDQPLWESAPRRTILICAHPRSGSTLLGEAIHFAGGLGCPLEYFHRGFRPSFERRWEIQGIDALVAAVQSRRTDPNGTMAVKLFWQDVEEITHELDPVRFPKSSAWADDTDPQLYRDRWASIAHIFPNPVFLHLERHDRLRQAASSLAAVQSGQWRTIPASGEGMGDRDAAYDRERMIAHVALADYARGHWARFFAALGEKPYALSYEDMDRDYAGTIAGVLRHLGSTAPVPPMRMRRQSDTQTESFVLQFLKDNQAR